MTSGRWCTNAGLHGGVGSMCLQTAFGGEGLVTDFTAEWPLSVDVVMHFEEFWQLKTQ